MDGPSEEIAPCRRDDTLLKKYDIPVSHLDFSYVQSCTDGRELEKILHILQSGQEGHFPDLMRKTEERLAQIKPNSKYIRKATPVLEKKLLEEIELKDLSEDLDTWLKDVSKSSRELESARKRSSSSNQPDIRKSKIPSTEEKKDAKRIKSTDYSSWDKYDPDTEILKMDIQAERMRKDIEKKEKQTMKREREVKFSEFSTRAEARFEANREREKGNECFKAGEYTQAITYYTNSINYMPSANNHNNRAIARIKLKDYKQAQNDCKAALKYEPNNIKALLRLVQCHESLGELEDGLRVSEKIIQIDPNNTAAQNFINKLKNQLNIKVNAKTRMTIVEIEDVNTFRNEKSQINIGKKNKTTCRVKTEEIDSNKSIRKGATIKEVEDGGIRRVSPKISFNIVDAKGKKQCEPDLSKRPSKSILKKKHVLLPIPGPSTMPEPYYVMVENKDPEIIKRQEYILNNRPQMICLNNIDTLMDENECLTVHIRSSHEREAKEKKNKAKVADLSKANEGENKENFNVECGRGGGRNGSKDCSKKQVKNTENPSKFGRGEYLETSDKKMLCVGDVNENKGEARLREEKLSKMNNDDGINLNKEELLKVEKSQYKDILPKIDQISTNNKCEDVARAQNLNEGVHQISTSNNNDIERSRHLKISKTSDNKERLSQETSLKNDFSSETVEKFTESPFPIHKDTNILNTEDGKFAQIDVNEFIYKERIQTFDKNQQCSSKEGINQQTIVGNNQKAITINDSDSLEKKLLQVQTAETHLSYSEKNYSNSIVGGKNCHQKAIDGSVLLKEIEECAGESGKNPLGYCIRNATDEKNTPGIELFGRNELLSLEETSSSLQTIEKQLLCCEKNESKHQNKIIGTNSQHKTITHGSQSSEENIIRVEESIPHNTNTLQNASNVEQTVDIVSNLSSHSLKEETNTTSSSNASESSAETEIINILSTQENDLLYYKYRNLEDDANSESDDHDTVKGSATSDIQEEGTIDTIQHCDTNNRNASEFLSKTEIANNDNRSAIENEIEHFQSRNFDDESGKFSKNDSTQNLNQNEIIIEENPRLNRILHSDFIDISDSMETPSEILASRIYEVELPEAGVNRPQNIDYDANNNKGDSYFNARKWNKARGRNGNRNCYGVEIGNERNYLIGGNMILENRRRCFQNMNEPHICRRETINVQELHHPYSFLKMWSSIGNDSTYVKHAEVLRNLDYNRLPEVIGYKLDGTMLSSIVFTLYSHFMVPHEIDRVCHILSNMPRMQRFRIISMFLSTVDKSRLKSLFEFLQQHGCPLSEDVMRQYF